MTIPHPTGSEKFAGALTELGYPAPWRLDEGVPGEVLAADGITCLITSPNDDKAARRLALWIVLAVNTLAGYRAEIVRDE